MGFPLPFVNAQRMCRQGCCTICTARVLNSQPLKEEGEFSNKAKVKMDSPLGLLKQFRYRNNDKSATLDPDDEIPAATAAIESKEEATGQFVLTCCTYPKSNLLLKLQGEDEMYVRQWAEGFEGGGVEWGGFLPEDD
eukprot:gene29769-38913_t